MGDDSPPEHSRALELDHVGFEGLFRLNGRIAPKVTVALGLLKQPPTGTNGKASAIPLANILGEEGFTVAGNPADYDGDLVAFYQDVQTRLREFNPPSAPPRHLTRCLESLNRLLPDGMNEKMPVVPRAGTDWHRPLLDRMYGHSTRHIRTRVVENARVLVNDIANARISKDDVPAQEPLLIVELAAMLDRIREEYA